MGDVVEITTAMVSPETVAALESLLSQARTGQVIGIAYIAMHKANDFSIDYAGAVRQHPVVSIGASTILTDELVILSKGPFLRG